jgi:CDP-diacylglycerol--serine O-phosphatidyltransferase
MNTLAQALILSVPLVISGCLHMAVVKLGLFKGLKVPIHREWFGANKTWRGIVIVPLATVLGVKAASVIWPGAFAEWNAIVLGLLLGLAYVAFELPNSYIKRRMGIPPGKRPPRNAHLFAIADQADSAVGCALVYGFALRLSVWTVLLLIAIGPAVHVIVNFSLYLLRLRKEPV